MYLALVVESDHTDYPVWRIALRDSAHFALLRQWWWWFLTQYLFGLTDFMESRGTTSRLAMRKIHTSVMILMRVFKVIFFPKIVREAIDCSRLLVFNTQVWAWGGAHAAAESSSFTRIDEAQLRICRGSTTFRFVNRSDQVACSGWSGLCISNREHLEWITFSRVVKCVSSKIYHGCWLITLLSRCSCQRRRFSSPGLP